MIGTENGGRSREPHTPGREVKFLAGQISFHCIIGHFCLAPRVTDQGVHDCLARRRWIAARLLMGSALQIRLHSLNRVFTDAGPSWHGTRIFGQKV